MSSNDSLVSQLLGTDKFSDKQVAETLTALVEHGVERRASDIHIEPHERFVLVRYRIDGSLMGIHKLPRPALGSLLSQLKGLAKLDVQETHMPQEGEYEQTVDGKRVAVRLSTMPVFGGEKAVLHLTQEQGAPIDLKTLGFWGTGLTALKNVLASPSGLVLVSGPKHSGVSTTLFSLLQDLNSPVHNIATIEPTAKHRLPGVNHTYLTNGMSTIEALNAALKQDPNVIMIDSLHGGSEAKQAIHAATKGHLILAGLHEDNSISAVLRLRHSGSEAFLLASALRVSVGQRLVRRLCPDCRERYSLSHEERQHLADSFGITNASAYKHLNELERTITDSSELSSTPTQITHLWRPSENGCNTCHHTGYHGRVAIVEVLKNTTTLHKALLSPDPPSPTQLHKAILKDGFIPMGLDGLVKALRGQTTISEVLRQLVVDSS